MEDLLLLSNSALLILILILLAILVRKRQSDQLLPFQLKFEMIKQGQERLEKVVREEIGTNREETSLSARQSREEISNTLNTSINSMQSRMAEIAGLQRDLLDGFSKQLLVLTQTNEQKLEAMRTTVEERLAAVQDENKKQLNQMREDSGAHAKSLREEVIHSLKNSTDTQIKSMGEMGIMQRDQLDGFSKQLLVLTQTNEQKLEAMRTTVEERLLGMQRENTAQLQKVREESIAAAKELREEVGQNLKGFRDSLINNMGEMAALQKNQLDIFADQLSKLTETSHQRLTSMRETIEQRLGFLQTENSKKMDQMREETGTNLKQHREEVGQSLKSFNDSVLRGMTDMGGLLKDQMEAFSGQIRKLTESNENKLEFVRTTVEARLKQIQDDNAKQLDQMRATVDEKLQGTLEKRLGESFKQVSERLEQVHKGLGEMQTLATGVGDLKRVLTNVKARGGWGEIQLEALLEQVLSPEQYERNVKTREISGEMVEFAIKLPGGGDGDGDTVWLPIDAKFPMEDYQRLVEAQEKVDTEALDSAAKALMIRIKCCARDIRDKYLCPPNTTDFGIMFLPTEGLYAEVVRRPGLVEEIQRECRVVIAGPTTLAALLNSLQMGFRTLAIQKRSSEVWKLLGAVKTEFGKFGEVLTGVKKKLDQASNTMDDAAKRSRAIERKLRSIQELPSNEAQLLLKVDHIESDAEIR